MHPRGPVDVSPCSLSNRVRLDPNTGQSLQGAVLKMPNFRAEINILVEKVLISVFPFCYSYTEDVFLNASPV